MSRLLRQMVCCGTLATLCALPAWGQDESTESPAAAPAIPALEETAAKSEAARKQGEPAVTAAREKSRELTEQVTLLKIAFSKAEATQADLVKKLTETGEALKKADEERKVALDAYIAARKAATEAAGKENAAATQEAALKAGADLAAKVEAARTATEAYAKASAEATETLTNFASHPAKIDVAEKAAAEFAPQLAEAEAVYAKLAETALNDQVALEAAQVEAGLLVSFSKQIAPIFAQRCVACHNARTAKGRLNMETFAALMKGGESGDTVLAHKPDDSGLFMEIEAGSMPKDADPLTDEQMALVKKWIETGARLDAGVSPTAALITIMPKPVQPMPPENYRVAVPVTALAFSPNGELLATAGYREVLLWNAADGQLVRRISNLAERPHDIEFSANGELLAVAAGTPGQLGEVKLFNVADGSLVRDLFTTDDEVFSVAFSPDGTRIAATCADRSLRVYDAQTGERQLHVEDHADWVLDAAWSPDGTKLATASRDKTSKVFNAQTGEALATFNSHGEPVFGVRFLPDGNQVVSSGRDRKLRVWNPADGKQVREVAGFGGEVFRVVLTPEGQSLASSSDKQVRLHNLANSQQVRAFAGHKDWVYAVAVHPGTKRVAGGSHDGEVRIWNLEDGETVTTFVAAPGLAAQETAAK